MLPVRTFQINSGRLEADSWHEVVHLTAVLAMKLTGRAATCRVWPTWHALRPATLRLPSANTGARP
jgi:hypothetical protein